MIEASWAELREPSGVYDDTLGRELTNYEFTEAFAKELGAYAVYPNMNGHLSDEAKRHNSAVTRAGEGEHTVAVIAKFPPESVVV